jgi:hypothetical protein
MSDVSVTLREGIIKAALSALRLDEPNADMALAMDPEGAATCAVDAVFDYLIAHADEWAEVYGFEFTEGWSASIAKGLIAALRVQDDTDAS